MWIGVYAANNGHAITDASFSEAYYNNQDGNYYVWMGPNTEFWCEAPCYQTDWANSDGYNYMRLSLVYTCGWPQSY